MIVRLVLLLLVAVLIAGVIGRWTARISRRRPAPRVLAARKCRLCEAYVPGAEPAPCGRADCPYL
jgi:hypothetical protein